MKILTLTMDVSGWSAEHVDNLTAELLAQFECGAHPEVVDHEITCAETCTPRASVATDAATLSFRLACADGVVAAALTNAHQFGHEIATWSAARLDAAVSALKPSWRNR